MVNLLVMVEEGLAPCIWTPDCVNLWGEKWG